MRLPARAVWQDDDAAGHVVGHRGPVLRPGQVRARRCPPPRTAGRGKPKGTKVEVPGLYAEGSHPVVDPAGYAHDPARIPVTVPIPHRTQEGGDYDGRLVLWPDAAPGRPGLRHATRGPAAWRVPLS